MLRIVHSSDYHWEADKLEKCEASSQFIIEKLKELKPDLHIITGDYWNRQQTMSKASAFLYAVSAMRDMADICPVVIIKGNNEHDREGSIGWFNQLDSKFPIYSTEKMETVLFAEVDGHPTFLQMDAIEKNPRTKPLALIHLFPYPTKSSIISDVKDLSINETNRIIQEEMTNRFKEMGSLGEQVQCPIIFAGHCNVKGAKLSTGQLLLGQDIMISVESLELVKADYYALGHIHKAQIITSKIRYAGSIYHCNFGETEKKSFNLVELGENTGSGIVTSIEIPSRPLSLHECEINEEGKVADMNPEESWRDWIDADLRIRLYQRRERSGSVTDEDLKGIYPWAHSYLIERITIPEERVRSKEITKALTLVDKIREWGKSIGKEIPEDVLELAAEIERSCEE